jgi:hypothetical protein
MNEIPRRHMLKSVVFGSLAIPAGNKWFKNSNLGQFDKPNFENPKYPSLADKLVSEVVGASHFDLEKVRSLVDKRPELAKATWDWGFGDFESALGAASHVGRRDIASYLMQKGARPDIFTYAMMGAKDVVEQMIQFQPEIARLEGPHGFSLFHHAKVGLRMKDEMSIEEIEKQESLIAFVEALEGSDGKKYEEISTEEKEMYLGDYRYGDGEGEGFSVRLNMRKLLAFGKLGYTGGALFKTGQHTFTYNGAPSVSIEFILQNNRIQALKVREPDLEILAERVY